MDSLNHALFLALNAGATPPAWLVTFAIVAAKALIGLVPLHMVLVWAGGDRVLRFVVLSAGLALVLALGVNQFVGAVAYVPRPFLIGLGHTLIDHRPSSSLPSNHASVFFTYAATLAVYGRGRLAATVAGLGLVVAWARIYLGVHFPFDMAAAAVVSAVAAPAAVWILVRAQRFRPGAVAALLALPRMPRPSPEAGA